ncbi:hypothetical protein FHS16_004069 [Paenibacillus endophyticus]|uniref:Uncharacterized protein n=1 Tax=Paenibacillus endophyticus TaxID=1294268 RepID=A0A7W5CA62_9BACL|nr:hypothetical protein [Paenibacillus endophyticus]MBB3153993.1 hypothetical protein [Paenibacillus endophyticus]
MNHPALYELEYLFECEAGIIEEGIPWVYGDAKFRLARENREIDFIIGIANRCGEIIMRVDHRSLLQLEIRITWGTSLELQR